jgi:hypothetical protein
VRDLPKALRNHPGAKVISYADGRPYEAKQAPPKRERTASPRPPRRRNPAPDAVRDTSGPVPDNSDADHGTG